jgi:hypothetical protein
MKAFIYGRVANKNAKWNLCFDDYHMSQIIKSARGLILAFSQVPREIAITNTFAEYFGECEGT